MNINPKYLADLRQIIPTADDSTYAKIAIAIQDSGVQLPATLDELHQMVLTVAESERVNFTPLIDLEEYTNDQLLHSTVRELADVKVQTLAEVFEQSYVKNFDEWLEQSAPLLTTSDTSLQQATLKLIHKLKTIEIEREGDKKKVILAIACNTIRTWFCGVIIALLLSNYQGFNFIRVVTFFGAISSIISPLEVLLVNTKKE